MKKLTLALMLLWPAVAPAASLSELGQALSVKDQAQGALAQLVAQKAEAVPTLSAIAVDSHDVTARGWAIVGLSRIGGVAAEKPLIRILHDGQQPVLVRTWAAAARVEMAPDLDSVLELMPLAREFPAVRRPMTMRVTQFAQTSTPKPAQTEHLLEAATQDYELQATLAPLILSVGPEALVQVMVHGANVNTRQQAAAYLATYAQQKGEPGAEAVGAAVNRAYAFQPSASAVPWFGGPLYVPGIPWTKTPATKLVGSLIAWVVFAERKGSPEQIQQINNNLNSLGLGNVVGYQPNWNQESGLIWLQTWRNVAGKDGVRKLLSEQGLENDPKYQSVLQ
jgi:hypothetical protein